MIRKFNVQLKLMGTTTQSIDVNAPIRAVYDQWTQFEEFPRFMEGVSEVRQNGPTNLFWKVNIGGKEKCWEAEITEQIPEKRIAWQSVDGTPNSGAVTFDSLDSELTRITLRMEYEPEGLLEKAGDALGLPSTQVESDLKRFRDFIEERGVETGRRMGRVDEPENPPPVARSETVSQGAIGRDNKETGANALADEMAVKHETARAPVAGTSLEDVTPAVRSPDDVVGRSEQEPTASQFYREGPEFVAPTHEQIALRAYELYLERGGMSGHEEEDWLEAEKQLSSRSDIREDR